MLRDQPGLTLDRSLRYESGTQEGVCQPSRRFVLMHVTWLELDKVHLVGLPDTLEVAPAQDRSLAQVRAEIVDEHPAVNVTSLG
jgi:hypothetical protein